MNELTSELIKKQIEIRRLEKSVDDLTSELNLKQIDIRKFKECVKQLSKNISKNKVKQLATTVDKVCMYLYPCN